MYDYIKPETVLSPRNKLSNLKILYDGGINSWSLATFDWNGIDSYGIRWNGNSTIDRLGSPNSHGFPTWFNLPEEIALLIKYTLERIHSDNSLSDFGKDFIGLLISHNVKNVDIATMCNVSTITVSKIKGNLNGKNTKKQFKSTKTATENGNT